MSSDASHILSKAYTDSGVNSNAGYDLVSHIKEKVQNNRIQGVISDIGGFGGLFKPDISGIREPVLVASTDGIGTKLNLAFAFQHHGGVGVDLVAMSVNDIIVQGAKPLFFLDYFACGKLDASVVEQVVSGVAEGCRQAKCALLGGETTEMPGTYAEGEYDLAGFCVGLADNASLVDGSGIRMGDTVIGVSSSGLHSNGYSLVRKILEKNRLQGKDPFPGMDGETVCDVLLKPTTIYVEMVRNVMRDYSIKGMAHITGGGFYGNIPRSLPAQVAAHIDFKAWPKSPLFTWLHDEGDLSWQEMLQHFNCGIGYVMIAPQKDADEIIRLCQAMQLPAWAIGSIAKRPEGESEQVIVEF